MQEYRKFNVNKQVRDWTTHLKAIHLGIGYCHGKVRVRVMVSPWVRVRVRVRVLVGVRMK